MDCNETHRFLEAAADGELDLARSLELDAHLRGCPDCARRGEIVRSRRDALREKLPRFTAPPHLVERIRASLRSESGLAPAAPPAPRRAPWWWPIWGLTGSAALLGVALLVGYEWGGARARANYVVDEAVSAHVRSLLAGHLIDVASSDQHTVKPWFAGKLDFSPPVVDLAGAGFSLVGGRLEHLDGRPAAALVFRRRQHSINLFIWPVNAAAIAPRQAERNGYHVDAWSRNGFNYLAVSEVSATELEQFAVAFRAQQP